MTDNEIGALETVPHNPFGINPIPRKRPHISTLAGQKEYMEFMKLERGVLIARINELNSRAEQIALIWLCRQNQAYLSVADRTITTSREADGYFYNWLDELFVQGVVYGARENLKIDGIHNRPAYRWDRIQKVVDLCIAKGLELDVAAKIASVGLNAVEMYLKTGIITLDEGNEVRSIAGDTARPTIEENNKITADEIERARQIDLLETIATATSSRGATMIAKAEVGNKFIRISAVNKRDVEDLDGFVGYDVELQIYASATTKSDYTPYQMRVYFEKDMPIQGVKFGLAKLSVAQSRVL